MKSTDPDACPKAPDAVGSLPADRKGALSALWATSPRRYHKGMKLMKRYGLSLGAWEAMGLAQGWKCAICGAPDAADRPLCVDHDHRTGAVRELVCDPCNRMLGGARDRAQALEAGAAYLRKHGPRGAGA